MMAGSGEEYHYQRQHDGGAPHGLLVAAVLGLVIATPLFLGDGGEAVKEAIKELLSPVGLFLLPVCLIVVIHVLSSNRGVADLLYSSFGGAPDTVHGVGGSPVGVALFLLAVVVLLYYRSSLFGGDGGDDE